MDWCTFAYLKNEVSFEKIENYIWNTLKYDNLSKILKNDLLSEMIKFRNDFKMIFAFLCPTLCPFFNDKKDDSPYRYDKR